jgi:hypothetical protein
MNTDKLINEFLESYHNTDDIEFYKNNTHLYKPTVDEYEASLKEDEIKESIDNVVELLLKAAKDYQ